MSPTGCDKGPRVVWWVAGLGAGPVALGLAAVAGRYPEATEAVYGQRIGPAIGWLLARLTGWIPFSLAEWLIALAIAHWIGRWFTASRLDGMRLRALGRATALTLREWSILLAAFMVIFGIQYRRPPLELRMGWAGPVQAELLAHRARSSVEEVNGLYRQLHGTDDAETATPFFASPATLDRSLARAWPAVAREFRLGGAASWSRGRTKRLLISPLLAKLGLSGFYFPWTGEANLNRTVPAMRRPHVMAHEMAHQRGIAREDEANFVGWVVARRSDSALARYSAAMYAHRRFLFELLRTDPPLARELIGARLPGVQRDVDDLRAYWSRHYGRATRVSESVNDRYLRSQSIDDGVASYSRSLRLLLLYAHARGDSLTTPGS